MEGFFGAVPREEPFSNTGAHEDPNQRKHRAADTVECQPHAPMIAPKLKRRPSLNAGIANSAKTYQSASAPWRAIVQETPSPKVAALR